MAEIAKALKINAFFQCLGCVGSALLHPTSTKNLSQIDAKIECLLDQFWDNLLMDFRAKLACRIDAKIFEFDLQIKSEIIMILDGVSVALVSPLEAKLAPNPSKLDHKPTCNLAQLFHIFLGLGEGWQSMQAWMGGSL